MNLQDGLAKLRKLLDGCRRLSEDQGMSESVRRELSDEVTVLYGELEELINRFGGTQRIETEARPGQKQVFSNVVEASLLSGRTTYDYQAIQHLLKTIGKIQQQAVDPQIPSNALGTSHLTQTLRRFRECCQYIRAPLEDENSVKDVIWVMLRCQWDRVEREATLPPFGTKSYRPDFGVPDLRMLIEAKFIGLKTELGPPQDEIMADVPPYLKSTPNWDGLVVVVYDAAHKMADSHKFEEDLRKVGGIVDVIVIPGVTRSGSKG